MKGQGDAMGSLPETLDIDHASSSSSAAISHQLYWNNNLRGLSETQLSSLMLPLPEDSSIHSRQNWPGSSSVEWSSSRSSRHVIGVPEHKMVNGWPSSVGFSGGSVPHLENRHQSANIGEFALGCVDANQLQLQHPNYGCNPPSLSLDGGINSDNASIVCPGDQVADVNGTDKIVQQQFSGGRVGSSDVRLRHVPCKRKSLEGHIGQSSTVPASFLSIGGVTLQQQTEPRLQQSPVIQEPGTMSSHFPSLSVHGSDEDSRRNSRLRIISSSPTSFSSGVALQNSVAASSQTSGFMFINHPVDPHSLSLSSYAEAHRPPVVLNNPASAYTRNSSTSVFSGNAGGSAHNLASSSRNTRNDIGHPVFVPVSGSRPSFQNAATRSVPDTNGALPGNAVYSSGNSSIPSVPPISQSSHPNMVTLDSVRHARYLQSRRLSEYVRQALSASSGPVTGGASSQVLHGRGCPTTGLVNECHRPSSSRSLLSTGRHTDSVVGVPNSRHLASLVNERRRRLVELRSAVELMRSGQDLRLEDIMRLHPSAFFGIANLHDRHRDLRLDVDNMSYEELLALEERIGNVSTGLNEETVLGRLKQRKFVAVATCGAEAEPCCICQEEYNGGDEVGTLDCGHEFHTCCIKQWLTHKNLCPICKTTGFARVGLGGDETGQGVVSSCRTVRIARDVVPWQRYVPPLTSHSLFPVVVEIRRSEGAGRLPIGLRLWVVLGICVGAAIILVLFLLSLYFTSKRYGRRGNIKPNWRRKKLSAEPVVHAKGSGSPPPQTVKPTIPSVSKEIQEIRAEDPGQESMALVLVPQQQQEEDGSQRIHIEIGKEKRILCPERTGPGSGEDGSSRPAEANDLSLALVVGQPEVSQLGWGHWFTLRELEEATDRFAPDNVIGEGGCGIVYKGVLEDSTRVAVKNLLNNRGQAEKEFRVEVEAIGRVRHKNLVRLLGYCVEGSHRMLVYKYVDNGKLEQWLHGEVGPHSPLTWDIRMQIIAGTAKGLTYLHEGLEPKVVHRDIKSSNILLDQQWNPKVSDFGLAKLLCSEKSYVTTRVMGTFGYVAPEYASTGMLNERSDVYSFGILIMEIISGRSPVDYYRPPGEVNLVEWLKTMVTDRNAEGILDPRLAEKPSSRALKRALLVALRCVDPNAQKRPKMGHVVHMLEADKFPFRDERRSGREHDFSHPDILKSRLMDKRVNESGDSSGYESSIQSSLPALRGQDADGH